MTGLCCICQSGTGTTTKAGTFTTGTQRTTKKVMLALYEAEQYHPYAENRYKGDFEKFQNDWKNKEYDPGMTYTFKDGEVEVLEVLQEEVDNIDHKAVKKQVAAAEDAKFQKHRKQRQRRKQSASKGSRYQRKYF